MNDLEQKKKEAWGKYVLSADEDSCVAIQKGIGFSYGFNSGVKAERERIMDEVDKILSKRLSYAIYKSDLEELFSEEKKD